MTPAATNRAPLSKRLRYEILRRDNFTCRYCGRSAPEVPLTVDHVTPVTLGGITEPSNLVAACRECNSGKASTPADAGTVEQVAHDAQRWAAAMHLAAAAQAERREQRKRFLDTFDTAWHQWSYGPGQDEVPRPHDWADSIVRFHDLGLDIHYIREAVQKAMNKQPMRWPDGPWKYFCGVCWTMLRERVALARRFLDGEEVHT